MGRPSPGRGSGPRGRGRGASPASGPVTEDPGASLPEGLVPVTALHPGGSCWPAEGPVRAPGALATTVVRASQLWGPEVWGQPGSPQRPLGSCPTGGQAGGWGAGSFRPPRSGSRPRHAETAGRPHPSLHPPVGRLSPSPLKGASQDGPPPWEGARQTQSRGSGSSGAPAPAASKARGSVALPATGVCWLTACSLVRQGPRDCSQGPRPCGQSP